MQLQPFDRSAAETVSSWARTGEEAMAWCSSPVAPVAAEVVAAWSDAPDTFAFLARDDDQLVGYGEIWIDEDESEVELGRIIVAPEVRGRGLGRELTTMLVIEARRHHQAVFLRVAPGNDSAIRCYRSAGFERVDEATEDAWNAGQPQAYVWMQVNDPES